uniref:Uncharacterized protein n=1 Tax=Tanacetum cinerariifolium TaxID=118510 RepID=A0A6L2MDW4_TANCI|nr:hypothetical protein [Tanacetum cinerariifolium]
MAEKEPKLPGSWLLLGKVEEGRGSGSGGGGVDRSGGEWWENSWREKQFECYSVCYFDEEEMGTVARDDVVITSSDNVEGSGDWNSLEYQDTSGSKGKKVMNALSFYKIETDEISERYIAPCFLNGLEAYDGKTLVKKELIVALRGELYFVRFSINPKEDDFKPGVILGRSFLRLAKGFVNFDNGVTTIYPKPDPFKNDSKKIKNSDDWDQLLDFNFDDVPKFGEELPPFKDKVELDEKTVKEEEDAVKRTKGEALKEKYDPVELEEDGFNVYFKGGLHNDDNFNAQDYWLSISREDNLGLSRSHTSTIRNPILRVIYKMITYSLFQRTTRYDKIQKNDLWLLSMFDARHQNGVLTEDVVRSLSALIYCRDLDTTTLRDLIDSDGKLILEDPQPGVPRVGIPRPPKASMQDLYDWMGRMKIRQDLIERMKEPTTRLAMLSRIITSTINSTRLRHHSISSSRMMTSSVEMARVRYMTACLGHEKEEKAQDDLAWKKDLKHRSQLKIISFDHLFSGLKLDSQLTSPDVIHETTQKII